MSRFTCEILSRGYEMDARQRVSPGTLARYMEHARWEAISKGALGLGELFAGGHKIVVRAQELEVGAPLMHGSALELSATVARVGNSSFTFAQTVKRKDDGAEIARSYVTAVVLGDNGRPTRVPDVMRVHEEQVEVPVAQSHDDESPAHAFVRTVSVRPSDFDTLMHVNQSRYVDYVDDTRALAAHAGAISGEPFAMPRRVVVDYRRETKLGHDLRAKIWSSATEAGGFACELSDAQNFEVVARARIWM